GGANGGSGGSLVKVGSGTLTLSGANSYTGTTDIQIGKLLVKGSLASASVSVETGAAPGCTGGITNGGTVAGGGTLAPGGANAPGTLTVGSLTLNAGSSLAYRLGTTVGSGVISVTGALTLAGTLNVTDAGGFGLGSYRLMSYGGALTDNRLVIGT